MPSVLCRVDRPSRNLRQAGFSLVELMVVITIIGILAGIAVPRFQTFRARSQQAEAKSGLNGLYLSMQAYQANYNQYPVVAAANPSNSITAVGFQVGGNSPRYGYSLASNLGGWGAYAISSVALLGTNFDYLRINTNKIVCAPFDAITGVASTANTAQTLPAGANCTQSQTTGTANSGRPAVTEPADCALGQTAAGCSATP